jgi:hypothetical protein
MATEVLEELMVAQLIKKFSILHALQMFIIVFTTARHWNLFWAR